MQANAGSLLIVAAPLCWGVIAAKPPRIALLQLSEMRPLGGTCVTPRALILRHVVVTVFEFLPEEEGGVGGGIFRGSE